MGDTSEEPQEPIPAEDWQAATIRAFAIALERRLPGITEEAHNILLEQVALDDVIRIHGRRTAQSIRKAHAEAERWVGAMAVIVPKHAKWEPKAAKRRRREKE